MLGADVSGMSLQRQFQMLGLGNRTLASIVNDLTICDRVSTPACIKALYQLPKTNKFVNTNVNNALGIVELALGNMQSYNQQDLNSFFKVFTPNIPAGTGPKLNSIQGGQAPSPPNLTSIEANLDFQVAYPLVYPQKTQVYQLSTSFNDFLDAVDKSYCNSTAFGITGNTPQLDGPFPAAQCGQFKPTSVISVSFGGEEFVMPTNYEKRQCMEFMKLGLQGTSVLFASGDSGTGTPSRSVFQGCLQKTTGQPSQTGQGTIFNVGSPVSCPYLTTGKFCLLSVPLCMHHNDTYICYSRCYTGQSRQ
jgi:tripeptidyl-peptidase I